MTPRDRLLAVLVAVIWGLNFVAISVTLEQFPPLLSVGLRFAVIAVPTLLLVPRPDVQWRWLLGYGTGFGVLQFVFLYVAMERGMPTGLASLVLQSSAPFTVLLAGVLLAERISARQGYGIALALVGLGGIGAYRAQLDGGAALLPVLLTLLGGLGWAIGNLSNRRSRTTEPFRFMLWMTVVPPVPMLLASLVLEGPERIATSFTTLGTSQGALALAGLTFTVVVATLLGSGIWTTLMTRYPSSTVAPFSLLVPVVGIGAAWLLLDEPTSWPELLCGALVVGGVLIGSRPARGRPEASGLEDGQHPRVAEGVRLDPLEVEELRDPLVR